MDNKGQKMGAKENQLQSIIFSLHEIALDSAHPPHQLFFVEKDRPKITSQTS